MKSISIIGMACIYPDATSPEELWENVLACRQSFRKIPDGRLNRGDYFSKNGSPDSTYCPRAALIEGYTFNREQYKVVGSTYRSTDLTHWLALDVASRALTDSGFPEAKGLPKESTGVLVGNSLTGEFSRANVMRLRWPFVRRVVGHQLQTENWSAEKIQRFLMELEKRYKSPFPEPGDETLAGGLSNTIAGRICNHFDFGGGGYTIDGACSSSLLAIANACSALSSGDLDVVIAGGVDLSLDPFELVGFSRLGALATSEMRLFDEHPTGFFPGEGCGMVVLMRTEDARRKGLRRHAEIEGFGISSDGAGGLTRPESGGQRLAVERAYRKAGYGIDTVGLLEAHGTGTVIGDEVELNALFAALHSAGANRPVPIGSIKANIGHTKAAAGTAGIIKTVMALKTGILPPTTGINELKPVLNKSTSFLKVLYQGEPWPTGDKFRAGVSAFGFGGINVHITLERSEGAAGSAPASRSRLPVCSQDAELFLVTGDSRHELQKLLGDLLETVKLISFAEFTDLSAALIRNLKLKKYRAAITAGSPDELALRLVSVLKRLEKRWVDIFEPEKGISVLTAPERKGNIVFLFPGQASPVYLSAGLSGRRFPPVETVYSTVHLDRFTDKDSTATAQPAIVTAEIGGLELLRKFGINAETVLGHSLGELSAMVWAGFLSAPAALKLAEVRGALMVEHAHKQGAMAGIAATQDQVRPLLQQEMDLVISCHNGPNRIVVSGPLKPVKSLITRLKKRKIGAGLLPVKQAFHSSLMKPVIPGMRQYLERMTFSRPKRTYISTITGGEISSEANPGQLLIDQLTSPVLFAEGMGKLPGDTALCIEVGPGAVVAGMTSGWFPTPVVSLDIGGKSIRGILNAVGAAYALGNDVNLAYLFENRFVRPFDFDREFHFFENPCEKAPIPGYPIPENISAITSSSDSDGQKDEKNHRIFTDSTNLSTLELLVNLIAEKTELPVDAIDPGSNLLRDLHLTSISVTQIVAEITAQLGMTPLTAPLDFSTASIENIALALEEMRQTGASQGSLSEEFPPGIEDWVRPFRIKLVETPPPTDFSKPAPNGVWNLFAAPGDSRVNQLAPLLDILPGNGILVVLSSEPDDRHLTLLLEAVASATSLNGEKKYFVLLQQGHASAGFARSFHHEFPDFVTCILDIRTKENLKEIILREITSAKTYSDVLYDEKGNRLERRLDLLFPTPGKLPLGEKDVLLVTGGGKGISAECALDLARKTGAKLVLLGRSSPVEDIELHQNLTRFEAAGIEFNYFQCDLTQRQGVKNTVKLAQEAFGPITAILHGAGVNHPKLLGDLTEEDLKKTLGPKVSGLRNLLGTIDPEKLSLLAVFGSIIAETGMTGEGDYALANGWLVSETEKFSARYPDCRCIVLEWSIWSGVGMGERLGRVEALLRNGITPITPDTGITLFRDLLSSPLPSTSIVVSGRMGNMTTLLWEKPELPLLRFLEHPVLYYPGIELITEAKLSPATDLYLEDHIYQGELIFPGVMGLEAIAQCAAAVTNTKTLPVIGHLEFLRPVVVGKNEPVRLRLVAYVTSSDSVEVVLRSEKTAFQTDHFRAICNFKKKKSEKSLFKKEIPSEDSTILDPAGLYGDLFFQSGRLQKLKSYSRLNARGCTAVLSRVSGEKWYSAYLPQTMLLGDHGSQDAALHAIQACIPHLQLLPVAVERWVPWNLNPAGPWTCRAEEKSHEGDYYIYNLEIANSDGTLREQWIGLKFKRIADISRHSWPLPLLVPYLERKIEEITGVNNIRVSLRRQKGDIRRSRTDDLFRELTGRQESVFRRGDGKPVGVGGFSLSAAHDSGVTLALAVSDKYVLGCDLHRAEGPSPTAWRQIFKSDHLELAVLMASEAGESEDVSRSRIWTALECLKKTGAMQNTPLTLDSAQEDGWVLLKAGAYRILTYSAALDSEKYPFVISVLVKEIR